MTNDYKTTLLEYLSGNLEEETGINIPQFSQPIITETNLYDELMTLMPKGFQQKGYLRCKDSNGDFNGKTIIYGYRFNDNNWTFENALGFIALLDENLELLECITQFSSGTPLNKIMAMNVDETGKLYAVDIPNDHTSGRIILLNNVSIKANSAQHYTATLRTSYFLQGNVSQDVKRIYTIIKQPNGANYLMVLLDGKCTNLKINVGTTNEWTDYNINNVPNENQSGIIGIQPYWDSEENLSITMLKFVYMPLPDYQYYCTIAKGTNDENNVIQMQQLYNIVDDIFGGADGVIPYDDIPTTYDWRHSFASSVSTLILNPTHFYISIPVSKYNLDTENTDLIIRTIEYNNGTKTNKYDFTYENPIDHETSDALTELIMINNNLFFNYNISDNTLSTYPFYTSYFGIMLNQNTTQYIDVGIVPSGFTQSFHILNIINVYNLYMFNTIGYSFERDKYVYYKDILIYNSNNYNGEAYCNTNTLIPNQVWLYDENDNIVFARNLYNKTIYNNITEATVEVPNTMLNDLTISTQKLIGETNYILCENTDDIEKNIYETLYINFFITLLMQNRNTLDYITNLPGSNRINNSVSETKDYENAKIGKVRINYTDGTSKTKDIISSIITNNIADIQFQLTILSDILNIEILSNDGLTTYQTITDFTDYDIGKTYIISQKCYVE